MIKNKEGIEIKALAEQSNFEIIKVYNTKWVSNKILQAGAQKPGLALTGFFQYLDKNQLQIFGKGEIGYLKQLSPTEQEKCLKNFFAKKVPGVVVSENQEIDEFIISTAAKFKTPILVSALNASLLIPRIISFLYRDFSKKIKINGVLMDIMGLGTLITGQSGIGKSEVALELINNGQLLVSDDLVEFYLNSNDEPVGRSLERIKQWMEVRGLGIINIVDLFGVGALLEEKKLELVINLEKWNPKKKYDRLGEGNLHFSLLGKEIPMFNLPVASGRNVSILVEVAVKYFISRRDGSPSFIENIYGKEQK
ncbi:MAG: HPr(Ser) kinase/phosphatase [Candidatus Aminicenantes bacterium]|nr:HPr(Ser) kinase/phosphatase [Candidatus Aminicenantes bacterium]